MRGEIKLKAARRVIPPPSPGRGSSRGEYERGTIEIRVRCLGP